MNYAEISKETIGFLHKSYASLKNSSLDPVIRALVELRTSQINGCAYCCEVHTHEARKLEISQHKLDVLPAWRTASIFSEKEKIALEFCENLTCPVDSYPNARNTLEKFFSEKEIVDLTACIAIMNALNRLAVSLKD